MPRLETKGRKEILQFHQEPANTRKHCKHSQTKSTKKQVADKPLHSLRQTRAPANSWRWGEDVKTLKEGNLNTLGLSALH